VPPRQAPESQKVIRFSAVAAECRKLIRYRGLARGPTTDAESPLRTAVQIECFMRARSNPAARPHRHGLIYVLARRVAIGEKRRRHCGETTEGWPPVPRRLRRLLHPSASHRRARFGRSSLRNGSIPVRLYLRTVFRHGNSAQRIGNSFVISGSDSTMLPSLSALTK
jgi:hypothetical protein